MKLRGTAGRRIRTLGFVWIVLAPVVFMMAAISTVESEVTYIVQLAVFSTVAIAAAVFGLAAVLRQSWSATGLFVLSCLCAAYFFGAAVAAIAWPSLAGPLVRIAVASMIAPSGLPFFFMARTLRSLVSSPGRDAVPSGT